MASPTTTSATTATGAAKRAFVSHLDSHLGKALCKKLGKAEFTTWGVCGDVAARTVKGARVVPSTDPELLRKTILDSDVIVYQLEDSIEEATAALKVLMNTPCDVEKTFVLVSSLMTWAETDTAAKAELAASKEEDGGEEEEDEAEGDGEQEAQYPTYSEEEYAKRVPHVKYQLWKEVEKLCKKANSETLHTYCVFGGLQYGLGEDKLHPLFKQAWHLAPEGLPVFGNGSNAVPTIHVADLATFVLKLATADAPLEQRYLFAVDEGQCTWQQITGAINAQMGNGRTYKVPATDYILYENIEHFTINMKVEPGKITEVLDEDEWVARSGFVENAEAVIKEFKRERKIEPLKVVLIGPPASGKTYLARELSGHYKVPAFNIFDVIRDYEGQLQEFNEELQRLKFKKKEEKLRRQLKELREKKKEEAKQAKEAAAAADAEGEEGEGAEEKEEGGGDKEGRLGEDEATDEDELFDDDLLAELEAQKKAAREGEGEEAGGNAEQEDDEEDGEEDEHTTAIKERFAEVKRVLSLTEKPVPPEGGEPFNPKDKKGGTDKKKAQQQQQQDEATPPQPPRYNDKALGFMVRWKLNQVQCRNQGYILDGFPKTVNQARFCFEEGLPGELPAPGEEDEPEAAVAPPPEEGEKKAMVDAIFPEYLLQLKAGDTFLTERVQKIAAQHPHNNPSDFQKRLEFYKVNNPPRDRTGSEPARGDPNKGVVCFMETALTSVDREISFRQFDVEGAPLLPPPPPESRYEKRPPEKVAEAMADFIGPPRNYGLTPQALAEEKARLQRLEDERKTKLEEEEAARRQWEQEEKEKMEAAKEEEARRVAVMRAHERSMLEARKEPLKQYLMDNIIPVLTKGIIEVCEQRPEDPIDYLADWLFRHNPADDEAGI